MTKKTNDKKEFLQEFRTQGILDAARKVIAVKGLDKATMEQVAEEAGISKATIYLYFKNKDALYFHCVVEKFDDVLKEMVAAAEGIEDPIERIRTLITTQMSSIEANRGFFRVFLTERLGIFLDRETEFGREFIKRHEEYADIIAAALAEAQQKGLVREIDPQKGAYLLFSLLRGTALCKVINKDETPLLDEVDLMLDVFFKGVLTTGPLQGASK